MSTAKTMPKTKPAAKKPMADHPKYAEMIVSAINGLKERGGSSRQAIMKYIIANFPGVGNDAKAVNSRMKTALKRMMASESSLLKQVKGSFCVVPAAKKMLKKKTAKKVEMPKTAVATPVKKVAKSPKKAKAPKKAEAPKKAPKMNKAPKKAVEPKKKATTVAAPPPPPKMASPVAPKVASPKKVRVAKSTKKAAAKK